MIVAYTHKLDPSSSLETELWSIYHGLYLAWGRRVRKLVVESNNEEAIKLL